MDAVLPVTEVSPSLVHEEIVEPFGKQSDRILEDPVEVEERLPSDLLNNGNQEGSEITPSKRKSPKENKHLYLRKDMKTHSEPTHIPHSLSDSNGTSDNENRREDEEGEGGSDDVGHGETSILDIVETPYGEDEEQQVESKRRKKSHYVQKSVVIAAVVIVQDGKLLMMQEAKGGCRGRWYIPAGRVELGESPLEGAEREVEEETGLVMEASGIFCVEYKPSRKLRGSGYNNWIRYGVTGNIIGGILKTEAEADKESIQAQWVPLEDVQSLELRNEDFLRLLDIYHKGTTVPVVYSLKKGF